MKYVIVVGDGMADCPVPELENMTPLQVAFKPNMDKIAAKGQSGLLKTLYEGLTPGSGAAILSVLGYDPRRFFTGRGPFEAASRGIRLNANDVAFRCNLITEKGGILVDYSAGHITSSESFRLIESLKKTLEKPNEIEFFPGLGYRHFLILRNLSGSLSIKCTPPHEVIGADISTVLPKAMSVEAEKTANLLRKLIHDSMGILESHPVNIDRKKTGKNLGNMIWPWGGGKKPVIPSFGRKYGLNAAVISAVDLVKGIGICAGMKIVDVPGATGLYDTNYEGKADFALKALKEHDLVFVHVEAPDEAGHSKDYLQKVKTIEDLDKRLVGRILDGLKEESVVALLPDHPTPIRLGTHSKDPVPFSICSPFLPSDDVQRFDEFSAERGAFGLVKHGCFMPLLLSSTPTRK